MGFGDLKSDVGLKTLNEYLADRSYIEGYQPSQADTAVFSALSGAPKAQYSHALRWYKHISSYGSDKNSFQGDKKSADSYGPIAAGGAAAADDEEDDDLDLFGSDDEEEVAEQERIKQERVKAYEAKKALKKQVIAKSSILLDVKPWDDETDMKEVERLVREIEADGLVWGASKLVALAYGIKKLQILCIVEDDKIGTDFLEERITAFEDHVQSVDIAAFSKI